MHRGGNWEKRGRTEERASDLSFFFAGAAFSLLLELVSVYCCASASWLGFWRTLAAIFIWVSGFHCSGALGVSKIETWGQSSFVSVNFLVF